MVVHGARLPRWSVLTVSDVSLVRARRARALIRSSSPVLGVGEVVELGQLLDGAFPRYVND
jgi:hypothetical protein